MFAINERQALYWFNVYSGNLRFEPLTTKFFTSTTEKEYIFSHAIAKFQHLVIFEE